MDQLGNLLLLVCGVTLIYAAIDDGIGSDPPLEMEGLEVTQPAASEPLTGVELSPTQPKDQLLKCHCSDCENKMCETDGYCYATIIIDSSGEKSIYNKKQACLDKNEPSAYKCWKPGGFYHKVYRYGLEENLSCCRNIDFCNLEFPSASPGGPPQPRLFPEASSSDEPGQRGGEGKASISPASLPDIILESCTAHFDCD